MAKTKDTKDETATTDEASGANATPYVTTPEGGAGPSAATLEEALAKQDELARQGSDEAAAESGEAKAEAEAEANAAIAEAGAAQEARDDEVYGRTPVEAVEVEPEA